ncbi:MAG: sugar/nucleoside kinase (ribokinase family) [Flavobacteriales bacterium]|mgnify:FL=1|jgi:sugar/nucleoside kinase (ribokinase family)|tara:strand:- start:9385 stop:10299 length:915 start_codon:yes stop_codon:yes gene_type:complete
MSLLIIGTVAFDAIETPFGKTDKIVGGSATYVGYSATKLGVNPKLVAVVGEDFPTETINDLKNAGFDLEGLQVKKEEKTFFWSGKYHNDMNSRDTLITELNVLESFNPVIPDSYQDCTYLMLGNLAPALQTQVIRGLKNRPKLIAMDTMDFWMDIAMDDLKETISKVDVLTINDEEARQLSGEYSLLTAAEKIQAMGPKYLIIKKGEHGALLFHGKEMFYAPALPLAFVKDPTGAGDTFAGGFMGYLASTDDVSFENMKRAVVYGSALASFTVEEFGTDKIKAVTEGDLEVRMDAFKALMSFKH